MEIFGHEARPGDLIDADKHGFLVIEPESQPHILDAAGFMDANECLTVIAAARSSSVLRGRTYCVGGHTAWADILRGRTYYISKTLAFTAADSGVSGHRVVFRNCPDEVPVIDAEFRSPDGLRQTAIVDGRPSTVYHAGMNKLQAIDPPRRAAFRKVEKQTVTDDVEIQLRDAILDGRLKPGESLAEAQLATQFGVSRASIRQAKFQLAQEGLLEFDSRGTASVRVLTQADVREMVEFREVLDAAAIRLACSRLSEQAVTKLTRCIEQIEAAPQLSQLTMLDIDFHEEIIRAADNSRLFAAWQLLRPQLQFWLASMQRTHASVITGTQSETARSHRELLKALKSGNADRCEQLARRHARGLKKLFDRLNAASNDLGASE